MLKDSPVFAIRYLMLTDHHCILYQPWLDYHSASVRQLAFAIASPNLMQFFPSELGIQDAIQLHCNTDWQKFYAHYQPRLKQLDLEPYPLEHFLQQIKSTRLGLRFEALLWFWLQDSANGFYHLIGHSIQSNYQGKTFGEIDFLLKNLSTGAIEHWEVCIKYYMAKRDCAIQHWSGLNRQDSFWQKLTHFRDKQFQFKHILGHTIQQRFVVVKGQLFVTALTPLPQWINPARQLGLCLSTPPSLGNWRKLKRVEWLCPFQEQRQEYPQIKWWSNGLYYDEIHQQHLMLRLDFPRTACFNYKYVLNKNFYYKQ